MNCPNCGTAILDDQQYCRTCGAELIADGRRSPIYPTWPLVALVLIFSGLVVAIGGKFAGVQWLIFGGVIVTLVGMFGIAASGMIREARPRRRPAASPAKRNEEILPADTTNKLPPLREDFIPSVIEDTTELLKAPVERKSADE